MPNEQEAKAQIPPRKFRYEIIVQGEMIGSSREGIARALSTAFNIPIGLIDTVRAIQINAEPESNIEIAKGNILPFDRDGVRKP